MPGDGNPWNLDIYAGWGYLGLPYFVALRAYWLRNLAINLPSCQSTIGISAVTPHVFRCSLRILAIKTLRWGTTFCCLTCPRILYNPWNCLYKSTKHEVSGGIFQFSNHCIGFHPVFWRVVEFELKPDHKHFGMRITTGNAWPVDKGGAAATACLSETTRGAPAA